MIYAIHPLECLGMANFPKWFSGTLATGDASLLCFVESSSLRAKEVDFGVSSVGSHLGSPWCPLPQEKNKTENYPP